MTMVKPIYFLSDLHLACPKAESARRVFAFLEARRGEAAVVYLVGDVFDFWLGYKSAIYSQHFQALKALAALVESGTEVVVFSGNHDPDPGSFLREQLGITVHEGPLRLNLGGRQTWVEHGDVIDPRSRLRRLLNRTVHAQTVRAMARLIHPDLAWSLARRYGASTNALKGYEGLPPGLKSTYLPARMRCGDEVVIIGHYHRPAWFSAQHGGRHGELYVLGDWLRHFTYVRFDTTFTLLRDQGPKCAPLVLTEGDHPPPDPSTSKREP
ncbi:MAG: UDP-2,3-diacylglucosamine diphosphatase [Myxococcales bacterium]|nr:UDP-2,3-diacylglucosamine diphosphatase [Myxococcales bacterium]